MFSGLEYIAAAVMSANTADGQMMNIAMKCPAKVTPEINVVWKTKPTKYIYSKSYDQLTSEALAEGDAFIRRNFHGGNKQVAGTASNPATLNVQTAFGGLTNGTELCTWPKQVNVTITYSPEIHISSDLRKGSCRYNEVMVHENTHIDISRKVAQEFQPQFKTAAQSAAGRTNTTRPIKPHEQDRRQQQISNQIMAALDTVSKKYAAEERRRQQAFDKREYAKKSQCPNN